jgi:uncharacterized membrane protein YphA (DoxX/SURF4 family)
MKENLFGAIRNILIVFLTLGMVGAGMIKLVGLPEVREWFDRWGFPIWTQIIIGLLEIGIGLAIFIPKTRQLAIWALLGEMLIATTLHIYFGEYLDVRGPMGVIIASGLLLFADKKTRDTAL